MSEELFVETSGSIARAAGVLPETVRHYADAGLVEHVRLPNGQRLFKASSAESVKQICAERMARRRGSDHGRGAAA